MAFAADPRKIVRVEKNNAPSAFDLIFSMVAPLTAIFGAVKLTQNDGDLAAHLRMGTTILASGHIPTRSLVSYTAGSDPLIAHAWLSEVVFALLFTAGGLPLLVVLTGIVIGLTHASIGLFLRRLGADPRWAFVAALVSLSLAATHWQTRPHMFSIVGTTLTLFLLELRPRHREVLFTLLFAVWANLHGGWLYGLMMIGAFILGELAEAAIHREKRHECIGLAKGNAICLGLAACATLLNPYGFRLHREVFSAVTSTSLSNNIIEYLSPNFHDAGQLPFLLAILLLVVLFAFSTRPPPLSWLTVILISLFFSLRSARNIALFGVSAWPLIALHAARNWPKGNRPFPVLREFARLDPNARIGTLALPIGALLLALGLNRGHVGSVILIADRFSSRSFPTVAVERAKLASLDGRVYDAWEWGGYIMYAWPSARLHVDPLKFNTVTMRSFARIDDLRPGWQSELEDWNVRTILIRSTSPLTKALKLEPRWVVWYSDSLATVFRASPNVPLAAGGG